MYLFLGFSRSDIAAFLLRFNVMNGQHTITFWLIHLRRLRHNTVIFHPSDARCDRRIRAVIVDKKHFLRQFAWCFRVVRASSLAQAWDTLSCFFIHGQSAVTKSLWSTLCLCTKKGGHIGNVVSIVPYYVSVILSTSLVEQIHDNGTVDLTRKNIRREGLEPPTAAVPMEGSRYTP